MSDDLDEAERRISAKWAAAAAARIPQVFDTSQWSEVLDFSDWLPPDTLAALPPGTPQFPREQWASYPNARRVALAVCEALLDRDDELTDEQWMYLCLVMQYGGKTRIA